MDKEKKAMIADYFTAAELVEYLGVTSEYIVELFEEEIEEVLDDIDELMGVSDE